MSDEEVWEEMQRRAAARQQLGWPHIHEKDLLEGLNAQLVYRNLRMVDRRGDIRYVSAHIWSFT